MWFLVHVGTLWCTQGQCTGTVLFILYLDDLISTPCSTSWDILYIENCKIFKAISSLIDTLNYLDNFANRCSIWKLSPNPTKYPIMSYTLNKSSVVLKYSFLDEPIKRVREQKDLGVIFNTKLLFQRHIHIMSLKCLLYRYSNISDLNSVCTWDSVKTLLVLEYCSPIWSKFASIDLNILDRVQSFFLAVVRARVENFSF